MVSIKIVIDLDNSAFDFYPGTEAGRILTDLAEWMDGSDFCIGDRKRLMDCNGNHVGDFEVSR